MNKMSEDVMVPVLSGAAAYLISKFYGNSGPLSFPLIGEIGDGNLVVGLVVGTSSFVGKFVKNFLLPYVPRIADFAQKGADFVSPVINSALVYGMFGGNIPLMQAVVIGGGATIAADYVYTKVYA